MRRWLVVLFILVLPGCQTMHQESKQNTSGMPVPTNQPFVTAGSELGVQGQPASFELPVLEMLDEATGWAVKQANGKPLKLLMTGDGGSSWSEADMPGEYVYGLKFENEQSGWATVASACKDEQGPTSCQQMQLIHSNDGGKSWAVRWKRSMNNQSWRGGELAFPGNRTGYALIGDTLLSTRDGGESWKPLDFGQKGFVPEHLSFVDSETGWVIGTIAQSMKPSAGEGNGHNEVVVFKTTDRGNHWQRQFSLTEGTDQLGSIGICFTDKTNGWFLSSNIDTWSGGLYRTKDGGSHWTRTSEVRTLRPTPTKLQFITGGVGWIPLEVGAGPIDGGIMMTQDGGEHFWTIGEGKGWSIRDVALLSSTKGWAIGIDPNRSDYLMKTVDGGKTWTQLYPSVRPTRDSVFADNQHGYGLGQLSDPNVLLVTSNGGESWSQLYRFDQTTPVFSVAFLDEQTGWAIAGQQGSEKMTVLHTIDGGRSWQTATKELPRLSLFDGAGFFRFFDRQNGLIADANALGLLILRTQDGGLTWHASERKPLPQNSVGQVTFLSPTEGWFVAQGRKDEVNGLYRMTDGETWRKTGQFLNGDTPYGLAFSSAANGAMLVERYPVNGVSEWHLLRTTDGGSTWIDHPFPQSFQLTGLYVRLVFADDRHGWISAANGLVRTEDGGDRWVLLDK